MENLNDLPTLSQGHDADLKIDAPPVRVWISRMTREDGAEFDNGIVIEHYNGHSWATAALLDNTARKES
jgi:hypothetical protein